MIPLIKLKKEVQFNGEFTKAIDVMKGIAAARFHVLEKQLVLFEQYSEAIHEFLSILDVSRIEHCFVQPKVNTTGVVMVTSDAGFLGGLNAQVVNTGLREAGDHGVLTVVGEQGVNFLRDLHRDATSFPGIQDTNRLEGALAVRDHVIDQVLTGQCGRLLVVYPKPVSFGTQEITVETFLPCSAWLAAASERTQAAGNIIWESSLDDVIEYVVIQWMAHRLDEIFAMSRLAELGARAVHLEGSYQELLRLGKKLKLQYLRARHELIDRSMREIFASQLLYKKQAEENG